MKVKEIEGFSIFMNKLLGKGSYGAVYEGSRKTNGEKVAVKVLNKASSTLHLMQSTPITTSKQP